MKIIVFLITIIAAILFYFSIKFGFDLKTAMYTLFWIVIWSLATYFIYRFYADTDFSKIWFYLIFGILLSFCFYPLLNFYSLKPVSYDWIDWAGLRQRNIRFDGPQRWFGLWYGTLGLTVLFASFAVIIQQLFDNDD